MTTNDYVLVSISVLVIIAILIVAAIVAVQYYREHKKFKVFFEVIRDDIERGAFDDD